MTLEKHFTATVYILQPKRTVLLKHPKLGKWLPPGGHVELNETPPACAKREALEETGLEVELIRQENLWLNFSNASSFERPYLCLLENIPAHQDKPAHQHIDFIYLGRPLKGVLLPEARWFSWEEIDALKEEEEIFSETKITLRHLLDT